MTSIHKHLWINYELNPKVILQIEKGQSNLISPEQQQIVTFSSLINKNIPAKVDEPQKIALNNGNKIVPFENPTYLPPIKKKGGNVRFFPEKQ